MRMRLFASIVPLRNVIDEIWPSPVARRLSKNRRTPGSNPDWSGCQTIDGLNNAADSRAYSWVKYAPISIRRFSLNDWLVNRYFLTCSNRCRKKWRVF